MSTPSPARPGRPLRRLLAAVALVLVALVLLLAALPRVTLTSYLPTPPGSSEPAGHTVVWAPGLAAAVVAGLALLVDLGWLVLLVRVPVAGRVAGTGGDAAPGRPRPHGALLAGGALLVAVLVTAVVSGLPMPVY